MRQADESSSAMKRIALFVFCASLLAVNGNAAINGVVINRTSGKPQAGATVSVNKLNAKTGILNDEVGSMPTDADGKFAFTTPVEGPTLLRITWDGVIYSRMIPPGTPSSGLSVDVFSSSKNPGASKVDKHMILFEPGTGQMTIHETILVKNEGETTWN